MKAKGLGKGLSALFSETQEDYGKSLLFDEEPSASNGENVKQIEISSIFANPNQPRKVFDQTALQELADSIAKHGVIMPIIVNKLQLAGLNFEAPLVLRHTLSDILPKLKL